MGTVNAMYIYIYMSENTPRLHFAPNAVTSSSNILDTLVWTESPFSRSMGHGFAWGIKMYKLQLHPVEKLNAA